MACEDTLNYCMFTLAGTLVSIAGAFVTVMKAKQVTQIHKEIKRKKG